MINPETLSTDEQYFADTHHMSVSKFKAFEYCEVSAMTTKQESSTAILVGSYVDAYISGVLEQFIEKHPEIISSRGATKGELKSDYKQADEICEFIDNDLLLSKFLSGEKQVVFTGEIFGVPTKIKVDSYHEGKAIVDLKVMASITNRSGEYYDFISAWGYDLQMAVYQKVVEENTGLQLPCYIAVVTKENPINSAVIQIPQLVLDKALYRYESGVERYYQVMQGKVEPDGCGKCKACISLRKQTPLISMEDFVDIASL